MKRAQSAVEFVVLTGIMLLFFAIAIVYVQDLLVDITKTNKEQQLEGIQNAILEEIALANRVPTGYSRTFTLPLNVEGIQYNITVLNETNALLKDGLSVSTSDTTIMTYTEYEINGTISPGLNRVQRYATYIQLN